MLNHMPKIAFEIFPPPVVWRAETGFRHETGATAAAVVRYEQEQLGNALGIGPELLAELDAYPASALLWVTFEREDALRYGGEADLIEIPIDDAPAYVLAADGDGGFLLFFFDDASAQPFEDETMNQRDNNPRGQEPDAPAPPASQPPPAPEPLDDEEERRRAGRGGGGGLNPANAVHGLNIRPDVVESPAGLETVTTMKSAEYPARPASQPEPPEAQPTRPEPSRDDDDPLAAALAEARGGGPSHEEIVARQAEESTRGQEADRAAQAGESHGGEPSNEEDPLAAALEEARSEGAARQTAAREAAGEGHDSADSATPGQGRTSGGRGAF